MSAQEEENKALILRLVEEVYNDNDLDVLDELLAQDFVNHSAAPNTNTASRASSTSTGGYAPASPTPTTR